MAGVDPFLRTQFEFNALQRFPDGSLTNEQAETIRAPMLLHVTEEWVRVFDRDIPDFQFVTRLGDVVACTGSIRTFESLAANPRVLSISASRLDNGPECGQSVPFTGATAVHSPPIVETGEQAIVGIIDFGVDVLHPAFMSPNGKSRVLAYWDQTKDIGVSTDLVPFGQVRENEELNRIAMSCTPGARRFVGSHSDSHGTHVASIAAGRQTGLFAGGVAPSAKLLVVRLRRSEEYGSAIEHMAAIRFILEYANRAKLPVAINLSLGVAGGARDGQTTFERAIENACAQGAMPGVVLVTSAGNQFAEDRHVQRSIQPDFPELIEVEISGGSGRTHEAAEFWFEPRADLQFSVLYDGEELCSGLRVGSGDHRFKLDNGNVLRITSLLSHAENGWSYIQLAIGGIAGQTIRPSKAALMFTNHSTYQATVFGWVDHTRSSRLVFVAPTSDRMTLTCPASAESVITVGACSVDDPAQLNPDSSEGPTLDGRQKPDLVAPGQRIQAASAQDHSGVFEDSGTSQAAAHIAGACALLLSLSNKMSDANPGSNMRPFSARQIKTLLRSTTSQSSGSWHPRLGTGVLDVEECFRRVLGY